MLEKAPRLGADIVMLDSRTLVAPDEQGAGAAQHRGCHP